MGNIGHQVGLGLVECFQLAVGFTQLTYRGNQLIRHQIEGVGQFLNLVSGVDGNAFFQPALLNSHHSGTEAVDVARDAPGQGHGDPVGEAKANRENQRGKPQ